MTPDHRHLEHPHGRTGVVQAEARVAETLDAPVRPRPEPVGSHRGDDPRIRPEQLGARLVGEHETVRRHQPREGAERFLDLREVPVVVEVVLVDVRDHRDRRPVAEERAVVLAGLRHEVRAAARPGARAERAQVPADHERRIEAGVYQRRGHERRRRGLPVGARDAHREAVGHQRAEQVRVLPDREAHAPGPRPAAGASEGWRPRPRPGRRRSGGIRPPPRDPRTPPTPPGGGCAGAGQRSLPPTFRPRASSSSAAAPRPTPPMPSNQACRRPSRPRAGTGSYVGGGEDGRAHAARHDRVRVRHSTVPSRLTRLDLAHAWTVPPRGRRAPLREVG